MIKTNEWKLEPSAGGERQDRAIREAAQLLRDGQTVAFPTETVYGLGADARNTAAVEQIFAAKGRPSDNPLIVHISDRTQLNGLVLPLDETAAALMRRFWPGPLTIVLPVLPGAVSPRVTAGLDTVAVRMPAHETALQLIAAAGCPVAAPSANRSGRPSPTTAAHVREDLYGRIGGIVDAGPAGVGLESTVVELCGPGAVRILRPGGVTPEQLREVCATVLVDEDGMLPQAGRDGSQDGTEGAGPDAGIAPDAAIGAANAAIGAADAGIAQGASIAPDIAAPPGADATGAAPALVSGDEASAAPAAPRSPGMKYTHYAPRGVMQLVAGGGENVRAYIQAEADKARLRGERTGVLAFEETAAQYRADVVVACGSLSRPETAAQQLYAALREFDAQGAAVIWAEVPPGDGIGLALLNRLVKAAGRRVVYV
ncbi:L-threonylcarbamoyladenylate synthase [Paenibacillus beijingensis]|uniref:Threonylcarbamoyl-AMP synthase n=1 Tax=Paenibacillus beijingensis TaxID=1126833 RepID=A0A0D5NHH2_9BACL|nr:L-threonylcarbamoyladenylate synthase [Paenibacillus beijingensis]AJY74580.1 translation factor [Paenibacillus beijingensis]